MNDNKVFNIKDLKYPSADKIQSRTSTVARSMASSLMPRIGANNNDVDEKFRLLYGSENKEQLTCVYCGQPANHLDHLFPLIDEQRPSGYYSNPANLVPCCSKCNGSKGSKRWWIYMDTNSYDQYDKKRKKILKRLNKDNLLKLRIEKLKSYCKHFHLPYDEESEKKDNKVKLDFKQKFLEDWWDSLFNNIKNALDTAQLQIDAFNAGIKTSILGKDSDFNSYFECLYKDNNYSEKLESMGFKKGQNCGENEQQLKDAAKEAYNLGYNNAISIVGKDGDQRRNLYGKNEKWLNYVRFE